MRLFPVAAHLPLTQALMTRAEGREVLFADDPALDLGDIEVKFILPAGWDHEQYHNEIARLDKSFVSSDEFNATIDG